MTTARRCLVLGSRQALQRLNNAVDQALAALDLTRVTPPSLDDPIGVTNTDVIFAEVSKPSPAISFELGIATANGIPVVYFATADARVSPVFGSVARYDPNNSDPRLAYLIAKHLEPSLGGAPQEGAASSGPLRAAGPESNGGKSTTAYVVGERFEAMIAHVDPASGFVLAGSPGRKPGMLHVSRMGPVTASLLEKGEVELGKSVVVEVVEVDQRRKQVQLRQVGDEIDEIDGDWLMYREARLVRDWAVIEPAAVDAERRTEPSNNPDATLRVWWNLYKPEIAVIRDVRNRVAHGEYVSDAELATALEYAKEVRDQLENPPPI